VRCEGRRAPSAPWPTQPTSPTLSGVSMIRPLWKVEDCFAQLGRWRRLSRSYEAITDSATAWLHVACVGYLLTKL
jgi:transposase